MERVGLPIAHNLSVYTKGIPLYPAASLGVCNVRKKRRSYSVHVESASETPFHFTVVLRSSRESFPKLCFELQVLLVLGVKSAPCKFVCAPCDRRSLGGLSNWRTGGFSNPPSPPDSGQSAWPPVAWARASAVRQVGAALAFPFSKASPSPLMSRKSQIRRAGPLGLRSPFFSGRRLGMTRTMAITRRIQMPALHIPAHLVEPGIHPHPPPST